MIHIRHQTHLETVLKFTGLLALLLAYFGYLSWQYDLATGGWVAALSWSFFVLCTPIADAGFLLDFPIRLLFGTRMVLTEILVWVLALGLNIATILVKPAVYETTFLTSLFYKILVTPWPYWGLIALCALGTFVSIYFGDEMLDVATHKERKTHHRHGFKYRLIVMVGIFLVVMVAYEHLITELGVDGVL